MKKNIIGTIFLAIMAVLVIFFGRQYAARQEEDMLQDSLSAAETGNTSGTDSSTGSQPEKENSADVSSEELITRYEENSGLLSILEEIDYQSLTNDPAMLVYYGDADLSEAQYANMNTFITERINGAVEVEDLTYLDEDTYELYIQETVDSVVASEADVVIYSMPALPDKIRDIGTAETNQYLTSILTALTEELPESEIILKEPTPVLGEMDNLNSRSLDYLNYMEEMNVVAETFGLSVLSTHERFLSLAEAEGIELSTLFDSEGIELNENGQALLQQAVEQALTSTD
ncbi:SGNH/GDSL hydrolase family protein [Marinilactibacillus piezotolerans]|uniref:SGNH/GDSL hydrolase family protein n=1 Tax=Marinilactibacillus piezotolerans TaxID=258723 RepID=UPI0009AF2B36|nr:SGNH/GDSL hydrolase family protein [Marinilactibacillus piezotolerans]